MKVAVIGCGPAGLAAVHAAYGLGADVTVISPGEMTTQRGPLLLQRPIPGITDGHPKGYIKQIVIGGSILDYRYRLYGDVNININGDILQEGYHAWDHFATYAELWQRYMDDSIPAIHRVDLQITPLGLTNIPQEFDLVVCTAPRDRMCKDQDKHIFRYAEVVITPYSEYPTQPDDTIIFNAGQEFEWVRSSRIFGNEVTEWPPGYPAGQVIRKPISTDCDCYTNVLFTGRFGAWRNETWVDTAYYDVRNAIISIQRSKEWNRVK